MAKPKAQHIAKMAAATFGTAVGGKFLDHLNGTFYNRPTYEAGIDQMTLVHNEGKRWMVHYINTLVQQGRDKTKAPEQAITDEEESPDA